MAIGGWTISDSHPNGALSVAQVIQKSSNVGTAKIQLQMPAERMGTLYRELGFGAAARDRIPGRGEGPAAPVGRSGARSSRRRCPTATASRVSLLQVARAYTVFTNDGQLAAARRCSSATRSRIGKPLLSRRHRAQVTRMMELAVMPGGTAPRAQVPGYRVAGKTGTAHKPENGGYAEHKYVSSFVGFGPVIDPRFIVAVMIDEPAAREVLRRRRGRAGVRLGDGQRAAHDGGAARCARNAQRARRSPQACRAGRAGQG